MGSAISGGEPQARPLELPATAPLIRVMAMPADANPNGDIFGGWLLAQMDLAGGNLAVQRARGRCATVAVDGMVFHQPVYVGDEVSCYGELVKTGRGAATSPRARCARLPRRYFTYVALGEDRRPRALPPS
jgi:acyl-CoA thioesterase YciA